MTLALLLPVGEDSYAVTMTSVQEVIRLGSVTQVPTAPGAVLGLFNLRGQIVALLDTARLLGTGRLPAGSHAVVVETEFGPAGLAVSGLPESITLGDPVGISDVGPGAGLFSVGEHLVTLLDLGLLLAGERIGAEA